MLQTEFMFFNLLNAQERAKIGDSRDAWNVVRPWRAVTEAGSREWLLEQRWRDFGHRRWWTGNPPSTGGEGGEGLPGSSPVGLRFTISRD